MTKYLALTISLLVGGLAIAQPKPGRFDSGAQMVPQASWNGDNGVAGFYYKNGGSPGFYVRNPDNTEVGPLVIGGGSGSVSSVGAGDSTVTLSPSPIVSSGTVKVNRAATFTWSGQHTFTHADGTIFENDGIGTNAGSAAGVGIDVRNNTNAGAGTPGTPQNSPTIRLTGSHYTGGDGFPRYTFMSQQLVTSNTGVDVFTISSGIFPRWQLDNLGGQTWYGSVDAGTNRVTNASDPVSAQDYATKHYADSLVTGGTVTSVTAGTGLTGGTITTSGTIALSVPVSIANGGTNSSTALSGNSVMQSNGSAIVQGPTGTSTQVYHGNLSWGAVALTTDVSGVLPLANGGTGAASLNAATILNGSPSATGDIPYSTSGTQAMSVLADVATGNAIISGGVGAAPTYGKIGLTTHVTGTLGLGNGGIGATTLNAAGILNGSASATGDLPYSTSGTDAMSMLADVAAGSYLRSGGVASAPVWSTLTLPNAATQGDIFIATATNAMGRLADVATGQVLHSGGVGANPAYSAIVNGELPGSGAITVSTTSPIGGGSSVALGGTVTLTCSTCITGTPTATGDLLASTSGGQAQTAIADVAAGSWLRSGGVAALPAWSTTTLPNSATQGDVIYASAANAYSNLADVAAGSYLRSGGVSTAPLWSTLTLPNAATTGDVLAATGSNAVGRIAAVAAGSLLRAAGTSTLPAWSTATFPDTATTGDVLYASGTNAWSGLADVAAGSFLRSGGTSTAPAWSTTTWPNAATTGDLIAATGSNALGRIAAVAANQFLQSAGTSTLPAWVATPVFGNGYTATGGNLDGSGSSGTTKTTTGAVTVGPGAVGISGITTFSAPNTGGSSVTISPTAAASGTASDLTITTAADTGQTASTEVTNIYFNTSATKTWAAGNITTQEEVVYDQPTYAIAGGASTITTAASLSLKGPPIAASSPLTVITNPLTLWVKAGISRFEVDSVGTSSALANIATSVFNGTAAALGAQQFSPLNSLGNGSGWGTTGSAAQRVAWFTQTQPIQGATPTGEVHFMESLNGGAPTDYFKMTDGTVFQSIPNASLTIKTNVTMSGTAVGVIVDTVNTQTSGDKILSVRSGGTEEFRVGLLGSVNEVNAFTVAGNTTTGPYFATLASGSGGAVGYTMDATAQTSGRKWTMRAIGNTSGGALAAGDFNILDVTGSVNRVVIKTATAVIGDGTTLSNSGITSPGATWAVHNTDVRATTAPIGLSVFNSTVATAGIPVQRSGQVEWAGHVWNTTATAADNYSVIMAQLIPTSANTPTTRLEFTSYVGTSNTRTPSAPFHVLYDSGNVDMTGVLSKYDNLTTAGLGVSPILSDAQDTASGGSSTNVATLSSPTSGSYEACIYISAHTNDDTVVGDVTYTDAVTGTASTMTIVASTALTHDNATSGFAGACKPLRASGASSIIVRLSTTSQTTTKASGWIKRVN